MLATTQIPDELLPESDRHSRTVIYSPAEPLYVKLMSDASTRHKAKVVLMSDCLLVYGQGISKRVDLNSHLQIPGKAGKLASDRSAMRADAHWVIRQVRYGSVRTKGPTH